MESKIALEKSNNRSYKEKYEQNMLEIKYQVDVNKLSSSVDFLIEGKNVLLFSNEKCAFKQDIANIVSKYTTYSPLILPIDTMGNPWVRDMITSKTPESIYIIDLSNWDNDSNEYSNKIITTNNNVSKYIDHNQHSFAMIETADYGESDHNTKIMDFTKIHPTQIYAPGGNIFHCVNTAGENYVIAGELTFISQRRILKELPKDLQSGIGSKSYKKYLNSDFPEKEAVIQYRQSNKQTLQKQSDNAKVLIVPNGFFYHIDLEMCPLPNGVILLHSHRESLKLLEAQREQITKTLSNINNEWTYDKLYKKVLEHLSTTEHLFELTKKKLIKHGFIVRSVCGFITYNNDWKETIATGFNGLPIVLKNGKIIYTMPKNEDWYEKYFKEELEKAGVSTAEPLRSQGLSYLRSRAGFFRCQTNTIPEKMVPKYQVLL